MSLQSQVSNFLAGAKQTATNFFQPVEQAVQHAAPQVVNFGQNLLKVAGNQPLIGMPSVAGFHLPTPQSIPNVGEYVQGQIVNPIQQGIKTFQQPGIVNKGLGLLQAVGQPVASTASLPLTIGAGATAGALKSFRTGAPLEQSIRQGIANPTSIATQGLGITGHPFIAAGIDTLLTRSPKKILEDPLLLGAGKAALGKTFPGMAMAKNQYEYINPQDRERIGQLVENLIYKGADPIEHVAQKAKIEDQLRMYAETYVGKDFAFGVNKGGAKQSYAHSLQDIAQELTNRLRGEVGQSDVNLPGLGLVGKSQGEKYAFNVNKQRLDLTPGGSEGLTKTIEQIKPQLEQIKGRPLSLDEVKLDAQKAELLSKVVPRAQTAQFEASLTATRERMTTLQNEIARVQQGGDTQNAQRLTGELIDLIKVNSSQAADIGRKLGSFRIQAGERPFQEQLLGDILKRANLSDQQAQELAQKAGSIDWNDANQVTSLYREYIKPTLSQLDSEYRYLNLLSSPRTHIVNAFSNTMQAGLVRPATKLVSGAIDPIASSLQGKARENYVSEVPAYYKGMFGSIPEAFQKVQDIFSGKQGATNLDINRLGSGTLLSKGNVVTKALEASDQFFRTIIAGGEREANALKFGKNGQAVSIEDINQLAQQSADYTTFRQGLDPKNAQGQGHLLSWIDKGTKAVLELRRVPGVGWFIPFVQTPMNILKQGVEYSPVGFGTLPGAANKTEQTAKALIGSTVFMGAGALALQDKITWAAPTDPEQKKEFYAAGMQPYSVKVGDKWVSFSKIGPLAYPMALAAAMKYSFKDDPNAVANGTIDKLGNGLTGIMGFFGDQSYLQGIGNLVNATQGQQGYNLFQRAAGNIASQYIPLSSFQRFVAQIIDPVYRKPETLGQTITKDIPFLSNKVPAYTDPLGDPSKRQYPAGNAFSPLNVTKEQPGFKQLYDQRQTQLQYNALGKAQLKAVQQGKEPPSGNIAEAAAPGQPNVNDLKAQQQAKFKEGIARQQAKIKGQPQAVGSKVFYSDNGSVKMVDTTFDLTPPAPTGKAALDTEKLSKFLSSLTTEKSQTLTLLKINKITEAEANHRLEQIKLMQDAVSEAKKKAPKGTGGSTKKGTAALKSLIAARKTPVLKPLSLKSPTRGKAVNLKPLKVTKPKALSFKRRKYGYKAP